jgi:hypothetical protein
MLPSATELHIHRKTYELFKKVSLSQSVRSPVVARGAAAERDAVLLKESKN